MSSSPNYIGGNREFKYMNNRLFKESEKEYETTKVTCWAILLKNSQRPIKWNKPTPKGTKVKFSCLLTERDKSLATEEFLQYIEDVNTRFGLSLTYDRDNCRVEAAS